ncbi:hypothetical protein DCS_02072 [Drechmeria coniospora]|uniref:Uncharacterized protein n=1 Tax=Drechmeria coniospora TaxID=98403 RepID=A0A151GV79_DRECN|nr:hypothetical protein DCS_02072 [Drechmeria coniospora]KYK60932.1 hypothetical protein DCS_02072 [Drechmeria coniospora]
MCKCKCALGWLQCAKCGRSSWQVAVCCDEASQRATLCADHRRVPIPGEKCFHCLVAQVSSASDAGIYLGLKSRATQVARSGMSNLKRHIYIHRTKVQALECGGRKQHTQGRNTRVPDRGVLTRPVPSPETKFASCEGSRNRFAMAGRQPQKQVDVELVSIAYADTRPAGWATLGHRISEKSVSPSGRGRGWIPRPRRRNGARKDRGRSPAGLQGSSARRPPQRRQPQMVNYPSTFSYVVVVADHHHPPGSSSTEPESNQYPATRQMERAAGSRQAMRAGHAWTKGTSEERCPPIPERSPLRPMIERQGGHEHGERGPSRGQEATAAIRRLVRFQKFS